MKLVIRYLICTVNNHKNVNLCFLEDEDEKNLRRISYLQATKEERMDVEDK